MMKKIFFTSVIFLIVISACSRIEYPDNSTPLKTEVTEEMIEVCQSDSDCIVVDYNHCCGQTKRAINKKYLGFYEKNKDWQVFGDPDVCATIGVCPDDRNVTTARCFENECFLNYAWSNN